jgi:hypothetical protein
MKKIEREWRRGYAKTVVRIIGITLLFIGAGSLPIGFRVSPKRDLSAFNNAADLGAFVKLGAVLMGAGLVAVILSWFLPGSRDNG